MKIKIKNTNKIKFPLLFTTGGTIYGAIEIMARNYTHISMFITGGICFILIGLLKEPKLFRNEIPVTVQMLISAVMITALELLCGLIVNVKLNLNVWDYSHQRFNLMGQICLRASSIWVFVSLFGIYADYFFKRKMLGENKIYMKILP